MKQKDITAADIVKQWARTQIYYRQEKGEIALGELHKMIGVEGTSALMFVTGFLHGYQEPSSLSKVINYMLGNSTNTFYDSLKKLARLDEE